MEAAANNMAFYIPPGYRFRPNDEEKMIYVTRKISNLPLPPNNIRDVDISKYHPQDLCEKQGNWYFFTRRKKLNKNSKRAIRTTADGFWKATLGDQPIFKNGQEIGVKTILVYYEKAPIKSEGKTDWIMHEYRIRTMDDLVLCEIHYRTTTKNKKPTASCNDQINVALPSEAYQNNSLITRGPECSAVDIQTSVNYNHGINEQIHEGVAIPWTFSGFNRTDPTHISSVSTQGGFMNDVHHDLSIVPTPYIQTSVHDVVPGPANGANASYFGPADVLSSGSEHERISPLPCSDFDDMFDIDKLLKHVGEGNINLDDIDQLFEDLGEPNITVDDFEISDSFLLPGDSTTETNLSNNVWNKTNNSGKDWKYSVDVI